MTVRKTTRRGKPRLVVDIHYTDSRTGEPARYRHDAEVQTVSAATAEERRLLAELGQKGYLERGRSEGAPAPASTPATPAPVAPPQAFTFKTAVELFRETKGVTELKATTLRGYNVSLDAYLVPKFGDELAAAIDFEAASRLDAELVKLTRAYGPARSGGYGGATST
jgi:hypothetical protein